MPQVNQNKNLNSSVTDHSIYDLVVIGGGAAGFFCAINTAEINPACKILILEATKNPLNKVKISGGGRCNVTNACNDPEILITNYPRGHKELLGPFYNFGTTHCIGWFESHGVALKQEADGRIFPKSNSSQSILDCFYNLIAKFKIDLHCNSRVTDFQYSSESKKWTVSTITHKYIASKLLVSTGSDSRIWNLLKQLGHDIIEAAPSLFTFNINDPKLKNLMGLSVPNAHIKIDETRLEAEGPLLITHWGLSGPAILKLSAWGARILAENNYSFDLKVNWLNIDEEELRLLLLEYKMKYSRKKIKSQPLHNIPLRLWHYLCESADNIYSLQKEGTISDTTSWSELTLKQMTALIMVLNNSKFNVKGKSTFKEEFVTAGGVDLKNINFKNFESKICPDLYLAGEVLNIDALTGGFNFQAAWTAGYVIANKIIF